MLPRLLPPLPTLPRAYGTVPVSCSMKSSDPTRLSAVELGVAYRTGALDPVAVTEAYLERIDVGDVYRVVSAERARQQARAAARRFAAGVAAGPIDGVPIAIKDLVDTRGDVTGACSPPLIDGPAASADAPVAARLDAAGAVFLGKTTMTELAFSGLGLNPHVGTPANALDASRVPGGSSSGAAVAVARGLAAIAVGSDTGGSVRIPASFNGLVGLKTSDGWIPTDGTVVLSSTLDTLGPIARHSRDAWLLTQAMAGDLPAPLPQLPQRWRLWAPSDILWEDLDPGVASACEAVLDALAAAGHVIVRGPSAELRELDALYGRYGSFAAHEALARYETLLEREAARVDPRVSRRILAVRERPSSDYLRLQSERERLRSALWQAAVGYDALVMPTVRVPPPRVAPLVLDDDAYMAANMAVLRATTLGNLLGGPVATVPVGRDGDGLPVSLSFATQPGHDAYALAHTDAVERLLAG